MRLEIPKNFESKLDYFSEEHVFIRDFLVENLSTDWQIYNKPSLNGLYPDFILINQWKGIQIIKILNEEDEKACHIELEKIKQEIISHLKVSSTEINITCCVASNTKNCEEIIIEDLKYQGSWKDYFKTKFECSVLGKDTIEISSNKNINKNTKKDFLNFAFPLLGRDFDFELKDSSYNKLKAWLRPNDFTVELFDTFPLDRRQQDIATRPAPSGTGMRKIKGGAGTGKTLTLAAKASHLILRENKKKILFLTFTRTTRALSRYSFRRSFISGSAAAIGSRQQGFQFESTEDMEFNEPVYLHFHGLIDRLKSLNFINDAINHEPPLLPSHGLKLGNDLNEYMEKNNLVFPQNSLFDAVLVDEGQLFKGDWWKLARKLVKPGGEAYIAADFTQDLGDINAQRWIDDPKGLGIPGKWNELNESYRLPQAYIPFMQMYLDTFLKTEEEDLISGKTENEIIYPQLAEEPDEREKCSMHWINQEKNTVSLCVSVIEDFLPDNVKDFSYPDLTFLSYTNQTGYEIVLELLKKNIHVLDTYPFDGLTFKEIDGKKIFIESKKAREAKRTENWEVTKDKVKASTIQSFQGFETSCLVFLIEPKGKNTSWKKFFKQIYTGLTRLKSNSQNYKSAIYVINMEPELNSYGEAWPISEAS